MHAVKIRKRSLPISKCTFDQLPCPDVGKHSGWKIRYPTCTKATPLLPTPFGRVRLLLGKVEQQRHVTGNTSPENIPFEHKDTDQPKWAFPLRRDTLDHFVERVQLPAATLHRLASTPLRYLSQHFLVYPSGGGDRTSVTMKLPDSAIVGTTLSLAISYDRQEQLTEGIILCSSQEHLAQLTRVILLARDLAAHPLAIPILVMGWYMRVLWQKIKSTWTETFKLETDSRQSGILLAKDGSLVTPITGTPGNPNPMPETQALHVVRGTQSQLEINQRSVGLSQLACGWEHYARVAVSLIGDISAAFSSSPFTDPDRVQGSDPERDRVMGLQIHILKERIRVLEQDARDLLSITGYQRNRLELQNNAVNNQLALNLGTTMKFLAVLNLLFLPAACISVRFSPSPLPFQVSFPQSSAAPGTSREFSIGKEESLTLEWGHRQYIPSPPNMPPR